MAWVPVSGTVATQTGIQYHALQAVESYDKYLGDAHREEHDGITEFIEECRQQDLERARRCHQLLGDLTT